MGPGSCSLGPGPSGPGVAHVVLQAEHGLPGVIEAGLQGMAVGQERRQLGSRPDHYYQPHDREEQRHAELLERVVVLNGLVHSSTPVTSR